MSLEGFANKYITPVSVIGGLVVGVVLFLINSVINQEAFLIIVTVVFSMAIIYLIAEIINTKKELSKLERFWTEILPEMSGCLVEMGKLTKSLRAISEELEEFCRTLHRECKTSNNIEVSDELKKDIERIYKSLDKSLDNELYRNKVYSIQKSVQKLSGQMSDVKDLTSDK